MIARIALWLVTLTGLGLSAPVSAEAVAEAVALEPAVVSVPGGLVRGRRVDGTLIFSAIPYAAPPLGELRWQPPMVPEPWQGVRDATRQGPSCLQNDEGWNHADWLRGSEDCLTLDVRTASLEGNRPVMVWIHGGSNRAGSSPGPAESSLVQRGVVVVSIQYRLGILGFLSHRSLAAEQGGSSGNYGLMDQIAGLQWVRDNIARFGGDPSRVTIFGESAGSQDVSLLLAAPSAVGLFRGAIMQSGTPGFGMSFRSHEQALAIGDQLDRLTGSLGDLDVLRRLSPLALFHLQGQLSEPEAQGNSFLFLRTTIDGAVLPDAPDRLMARRPALPVIIGSNAIEFGPGPGGVALDEFARFWFGENSERALAAYRAEEAAGADPRRGNLELRMQSDAQFHCPANRLARHLMGLGWPVWRYEFDAAPDGGLTRHALEIAYVFDNAPLIGGVGLQDYWVGLALYGNPDGARQGGLQWPALTMRRARTMRFGPGVAVVVNGQPRDDFCGFADAL